MIDASSQHKGQGDATQDDASSQQKGQGAATEHDASSQQKGQGDATEQTETSQGGDAADAPDEGDAAALGGDTQSGDAADEMELQFCRPCKAGAPMSNTSFADLGEGIEDGVAVTAENAEASGLFSFVGRGVRSLGSYAAESLLPQCSCHDPISGLIVHRLQNRRARWD